MGPLSGAGPKGPDAVPPSLAGLGSNRAPGLGWLEVGETGEGRCSVLGSLHVHVTATRLRVPPPLGKVGCAESSLGENDAPC